MGEAEGHGEGGFHLNRGLSLFSASSGGTKDMGVKGTMVTACKGRVAGQMGPGEGARHGTIPAEPGREGGKP